MLLIALTALMMSSCVTRLTDFTFMSTKNVTLKNISNYKKGPRVIAEDKKRIITVIPTGVPNVKEAIDKAIESVPNGAALTDGVISKKWFYVPYIYGEFSYIVEGNVLLQN